MRSLIGMSSLLSVVALSLCHFTAAAGEYWISPTNSLGYLGSSTQLGQGTWEDPYRGNFDQIISSIGINSIIHLWPGVYWSTGQVINFSDQKWRTGVKLRGSGVDTTVLRITNEPNSWVQMAIVCTSNNGVEVSDLTAEYSTAPSAVAVRDGIILAGSDSKIDRVKVRGLYGVFTNNQESFGLKVGNEISHKGGRIADCEVSGPFYGDYHSATIVSGEAVVRNNRVIFDKVAGQISGNDSFKGLTFGDANHVSIVGNYQYGGSYGVFSDWAACTNVVAAENHFRLTKIPITLIVGNPSQQWRDIYFVKNLVEADCDISWASYIATTNGASITNIVIADNVIVPYFMQSTNRTVALNIQKLGGGFGQMAGVRIFRNVWPTNTAHALGVYAPLTMSDNLDVEGVPHHLTPETLDNYNEVNAIAAMPTVTYTLGGTWPANDQLLRVNQSVVIVNGGSGSGTLKLPVIRTSNNFKWSGRQITIINASTSGTVTISVSNTALEQIMKSDGTTVDSMTVGAGTAPAKFISGDDSTWYQL